MEVQLQQGLLDSGDTDALMDWSIFHAPDSQVTDGWKSVELSTHWLNALTPPLELESPGRTTLASVVETVLDQIYPASFYIPLGPSGGRPPNNAAIQVNSVVATFVADGMSRLGWDENHISNLTHAELFDGVDESAAGWNWQSDSHEEMLSSMITGKANLVPNPAYRLDNGDTYSFRVTQEGLGIKVQGVAWYLALTVLFLHVALVVAHVGYTLTKRRTSRSWASLTDLLLLCHSSRPQPDTLQNTCAGREVRKTLQLSVRVREIEDVPVGCEELQLLVDKQEGKEVEQRKAYGARV